MANNSNATTATRLTIRGLMRLAICGAIKPPRMAAGNMIRKNVISKFPN